MMQNINRTAVISNKFMTYSAPYMIFLAIIYIIALVINSMTIMWIHKLEEISCTCSDDWMRSYIKYFLYIYFVMIVLSLVVNIYLYMSQISYRESKVYQYFGYLYVIIFNILGFINIIIALVYIDRLIRINCTCSEDIRREVYWYYNIIKLALFGLLMIISLIFMMFMRSLIRM